MVILPIVPDVLPPQAEVDAMSPDEEMVTNDSSIVDAQINIQVVRAAQAMEARFRLNNILTSSKLCSTKQQKPTRITKSSYFDFQFDPQVPREPPSSRLPSSSRLIVIFKYLNVQYGVLQIFENPIWSSRTRIFHENQSYLQQWKNSVPSVLSAFDDTQDCQAVFFAKYFVPLVIPDQM